MSAWVSRMCSSRCQGVYSTFGGNALIAVVGEVGDGLVEGHPGADPVKEGDELTAQAVRVGIGHGILGGRAWAAPS